MKSKATVKFYTAIVDGPGEGPAGDGTFIVRFRTLAEAKAYCKDATCYGRPVEPREDEAPRRLAVRWGVA